MDWKHLLFGFSGRMNRAKFWLVSGLSILFIAVVAAAVYAAMPVVKGGEIAAVVFLLPLYVGLAAGAKRFHDRDMSAWWLLVVYLVPGAIDGIGQAVGNEGVGLVLSAISLAITIWGFVVLGCLRGTIGPNRYGPDPLGVRA